MQDGKLYEVESIVDKRTKNNVVEYFIKWKGYPTHHNTWEPADNLLKCKSKIKDFETRYSFINQERNQNGVIKIVEPPKPIKPLKPVQPGMCARKLQEEKNKAIALKNATATANATGTANANANANATATATAKLQKEEDEKYYEDFEIFQEVELEAEDINDIEEEVEINRINMNNDKIKAKESGVTIKKRMENKTEKKVDESQVENQTKENKLDKNDKHDKINKKIQKIKEKGTGKDKSPFIELKTKIRSKDQDNSKLNNTDLKNIENKLLKQKRNRLNESVLSTGSGSEHDEELAIDKNNKAEDQLCKEYT